MMKEEVKKTRREEGKKARREKGKKEEEEEGRKKKKRSMLNSQRSTIDGRSSAASRGLESWLSENGS